MRALSAVILTFALATSATAAHAQSPTDKATARVLADEGEAALARKDFPSALQKFEKANLLVPNIPTLLVGLARAQAGVGKLVEARESYNLVARMDLGPSPSAPFKEAQQAARTEMPSIAGRIGRLEIIVKGPSNATVTLDGEVVSAASLGEKRPTNPGTHLVKAQAPGHRDAEAKVVLKDGGQEAITLTLEPGAAGTPVAGGPSTPAATSEANTPPPAAQPPSPPARTSSWRTGSYVALGVGGAGLVLGTVTGLLAMGKKSDLEKVCSGGHCPIASQGDIDSLGTMTTLSTVGFIVGGVGVASGVGLFVLSPKPGASTAVRVGPSSVSLVGSF